MKHFIFIITILFVFNGCSSNNQTDATKNAVNSSALNSNQANTNGAAATNANPMGMQPYNGIQNVNPNAFNAPNDNLKVIQVQPSKNQPPIGSRTAPDDSIITSGSRGKDFFEARTFNSHSVLAKVEKIMDGKTTKYKIYLKSGKILDAPADKMSNFEAMSPENILDVVGMLPKPQTIPQTKSEAKKDEKPQ